MNDRAASSSAVPSEKSSQQEKRWSHPGGKLVELGSHTLKQYELLAILIGSGTAGRPATSIANAVLDIYIGLYGIHREATVEDLAKIAGLGRRKASRIMAAIEIGRKRYRAYKLSWSSPSIEDGLFQTPQPPSDSEPQPKEPDDVDLLATIIGSGVRGRPPKVIAKDLLARFDGTILGLFGQFLGEELRIKGLNSVKIIRIIAALEVGKRVADALS
ncbi:MAG: hypothetical protein QME66_02415 [Candidatus Eisenbacteria bacterium]|nr:hypothetical protein [Candidatus Eisenbacteria bacterium]